MSETPGRQHNDIIGQEGFRLPRRLVNRWLGLLAAAAAGGSGAALVMQFLHERAKQDAVRDARQAGLEEGRHLEGERGERAAEEAARLTGLLNRGLAVPARLLNGTIRVPVANGNLVVENPILLRSPDELGSLPDPAEAWWGVQEVDAQGVATILPRPYNQPNAEIDMSLDNQGLAYLPVTLRVTQVKEGEPNPREYFAVLAQAAAPDITVFELLPARELVMAR